MKNIPILLCLFLLTIVFFLLSSAEAACNIKGNISYTTQERIYHLPSCPYYSNTEINESYGERWFCSEAQAQRAGWRKARNCPYARSYPQTFSVSIFSGELIHQDPYPQITTHQEIELKIWAKNLSSRVWNTWDSWQNAPDNTLTGERMVVFKDGTLRDQPQNIGSGEVGIFIVRFSSPSPGTFTKKIQPYSPNHQYTIDIGNVFWQITVRENTCQKGNGFAGHDKECHCRSGYLWNDSQSKCITHTESCHLQYGNNTYGDEQYCYCTSGYKWNEAKTQCVMANQDCPANSFLGNDGKCYCNKGFKREVDWSSILKNGYQLIAPREFMPHKCVLAI